MTKCPKCDCTRITGPTYHRLGWGGEHLRYTCARCGYVDKRPCKDSLAKDYADGVPPKGPSW